MYFTSTFVSKFASAVKIHYVVHLRLLTNSSIIHQASKLGLSFSNAEEEKILNIINSENSTYLLKNSLQLSDAAIKSLENHKSKNGPFQTVGEVLKAGSLDVPSVTKIIYPEVVNKNITKSYNSTKKTKQVLTPPLSTNQEISSIVGVYLSSPAISWVKLNKCKSHVESWEFESFVNLPAKMAILDTFKFAVNVTQQLPCSDIYVMEGPSTSAQSQSTMSFQLQHELSAMLMALINVKKSQHEPGNTSSKKSINKVYFLRRYLSARLFGTLVGNESVSSKAVVQQLLESTQVESFSLPCTPITVDKIARERYLNESSSMQQEILGQALMLTIAFADVCVFKNPRTLEALKLKK